MRVLRKVEHNHKKSNVNISKYYISLKNLLGKTKLKNLLNLEQKFLFNNIDQFLKIPMKSEIFLKTLEGGSLYKKW